MRRVVGSAVVLALAVPAEGQVMRAMMSLRGSSNSYMSSSTWFRGSDGQMHHKVLEEREDTTRGEYGMKHTNEKIVCKDGHCQKETMTMIDPRMAAPNAAEPPCHMRMRLQRMMNRMASMVGMSGHEMPPMPMVPPPMMDGMPVPPPMVGVDLPPMAGMPPPPPPPPVMMNSAPGTSPHMVVIAAPSLRGILRRIHGGGAPYSIIETRAVPAPRYKPDSDRAFLTMVAAPAMAGCCLVLASLLAAFKLCQGGSQVSAREPTLRSRLGEPLAPIPEEFEEESPKAIAKAKVMVPATVPPPAPAATAAKSFLQGIYCQAETNVEGKAMRSYLASVYMRAAAETTAA